MKRSMQLLAVWLGLLATATYAQTQEESDVKWSRQLESVGGDDTDSLDWVPLAQPLDGSSKDRSGNGRVLTYSQSFPPSGRFGDLNKPSGSQFDFPYNFQRYSNGAPQALPLRHQGPPPLKSSSIGQEPTSQSFFKFEMPFHNDANQANAPPTLQTGYQIQHSFGGASHHAPSSFFSPPSLYGQQGQQHFSDFQTLPQKPLSKPLQQQNYIQDIHPLKSHGKPIPTQPSLQSVTPQVFPVDPEPETLFGKHTPSSSSSANNQQEVQLLYVPYDTLYNQQRGQPQSSSSLGSSSSFEVNKFNVNAGLPAVNPYQINQFYTQDPSVGSDFFSSGTTKRPSTTTTTQPQHIFQSFGQQQSQAQAQSYLTTAKPKPKAHQPPLAMFLLRPNSRPTQSDVVAALRNARSISVIDAPTKQTPDIFVGPSGMPIPDGYVKFDLPYLSQLTHSRNLGDVSFFVAPLSYRAPNGFNKILLPEPHVGSIVINRAKDSASVHEQPLRSQRPHTTPPGSTRNPFETTTQVGPAPTRGNKFSYYYVQDAKQESAGSPPKQTGKQERHKKKRPQHVTAEQPVYRAPAKTPNPFDTLNQIGGDDFFNTLSTRAKPSTTSSTSTSTSTTSTTSTSTTATPQTLFTYGSRPQVEFPSTNGQLYPQFETAPQLQQKQPQEQLPRLTTLPPTHTTVQQEEHRMKQYFRQQDAFRQRPLTTNPPYEQVQYTQTSQDYDTPQPTTTQKTKQRLNLYTPVTTSDVGYNVDTQEQVNHRPSFNQNEVIDSGNVEYEPNPYHVPSELPALTPDIPGLVNNLQEKDKLATSTTPLSEPEPETRPTRRPVLRTRKPAVSKVVTTSSVSYSESDSSPKQPTHRIRRPYGNRGNSDNIEESPSTTRRPASSRSPLLRNPNRIRYQPTNEERTSLKTKKKHHKGSKNGKPIEDQDLEYQRDVLNQNYPVFKAPSRRPTSPTAIPGAYDVGNTEGPASESQQIYTVTPSNSIDQGEQGSVYPPSLELEPMQIAQHYNEFSKDNYGPGYFPNQEDLNPTEAIIRNEVSPIYTTLATTTPATTTTTTSTTVRTTTEAPVTTTTRRSPFVRRNYPRVRTTTTTEASVTTTTPSEERPSIRSRLSPRRVVKVRQRQRRPSHPASSTAAPEEEVEPVTQRQHLRKLSRYQTEQPEKEKEKEQAPLTHRRRYKQPFQLEGQESQWSPASETGNINTLPNSNSFKPLNPKYSSKSESHNFDNEPDIVTAGPTGQPETYEFNVAANFGGSDGQQTTPAFKAPNLKPEKSFAELLEEVMGKAPEELATELPTSSTVGRLNRRGKWKKSRVSGSADNGENFEAAESQNLATQLYNSLYSTNANLEGKQKTTTPLTPTTETPTTIAAAAFEVVTTSPAAPSTPEEYELTSETPELTTLSTTLAKSEESATRRMDTAADVDDLDTQPSIFSEVRQQLHDLFAVEESEDDAVAGALAAVGKRRQEYTNIKRTKPVTPTESSTLAATETPASSTAAPQKDNFHKDLMEHVVYATSTSTKVTSETEICYRGRCIRSEDLPANHKLH